MSTHWWVLTDLAGGYHLQALLVCSDATPGTQVTLVEGTPVGERVGGEVGVQLPARSASHRAGGTRPVSSPGDPP